MGDESGPSEISPNEIIKAIEDPASYEATEIILEQPVNSIRFRYMSEQNSISIIPGVNTILKEKIFPSIQIEGYEGRAAVIVSCVTKDPPYRPHPHSLVGKKCKQGICIIKVSAGDIPKIVTFSNLEIQCIKKADIEEALKERQALRIDPFRTGFEHRRHPTNIDLNAVRLCFQVFLEESQKGKFKPLQPIVSNPIHDRKAMSDLVLDKLSHCRAAVAGGLKMMLLCERVAKEDIKVRFFEEKDGQMIWEGFGDFQPTDVHKQVAITFTTSKYRSQEVGIYPVCVQLLRPSDQATSNSLPFWMIQKPLDIGKPAFWSFRKTFARKKTNYNTYSKIFSTENALLTNAAPKFSHNIDEFNNNEFNARKSTNKISALCALNNLYNVKNHVDLCNDDLKAMINSAQNADNTARNAMLNYENNEAAIVFPVYSARKKKVKKYDEICEDFLYTFRPI